MIIYKKEMKKVIYILSIIFIFMGSYNSSLSYSWEQGITIKYLIKYSDNKIYNLEKIIKKYNLENDKYIKSKIQELKNIKKSLEIIKYNKKYELINQILKKLKENNNSLKDYLKKKLKENKKKLEKYKKIYYQKIKKILLKIDYTIKVVSKEFYFNQNKTVKNKQILDLLYLIKIKLDNLKNLEQKNFYSKKEMINYIVDNFRQIQFHFRQIKNIIKSS